MQVRRRHILTKILATVLIVVFLILNSLLIAVDINKNRLKQPPEDMHEKYCATLDHFGPVIELEGEAEITLTVGESFDNSDVKIDDFCGVKDWGITGEVDVNTVGTYEIKYHAEDINGNRSEVVRTVTIRPVSRGTVYLTFDDGPGAYTAELLDILAKYKVKATFFVTGAGSDDLILREYNEGHTVALHTMSHNYAAIYQNMDAFFADLYAVQARVKNITGETVTLMRFPGGSSNTVSALYDGGARIMSKLTAEVERRGFTYFDWNISSGDAGGANSADAVYNNTVSRFIDGGSSVVLQHDIKGFSVAAVERIIQYGLANGWTFEKLTAESFTAHHGINN